MDRHSGRFVVLTGVCLSIMFFALVLFVLNPFIHKGLESAQQLEENIERQLSAPLPEHPDAEPSGADPLEIALATQAAVLNVHPRLFYEDVEEDAFELAQIRLSLPSTAPELAPPRDVEVRYRNGVVTVSWKAGRANATFHRLLRQETDGQLRLAFRIMRSSAAGAPVAMQTRPFGVESWHDRDLPLAAARLSYEVWAVLLRGSGDEQVLVAAERSDIVTVATPEHFTLDLIAGSSTQARFELMLAAGGTAGAEHTLHVNPGEPLLVDQEPTGLTLSSLAVVEQESLSTRQRLVLTPDGAIVLDPITQLPRKTQTTVLIPVTRLRAELLDESGAARTLEVDLP